MADEAAGSGYVFAVWPVNEVRGNLPAILDQFAEEGPLSPPILIGRHRKPEAALVPYRLLARLLTVYEEQQAPQMMANDVIDRANAPDWAFTELDQLP